MEICQRMGRGLFTREPNLGRGLALLLPYPVLSAVVDVYTGHTEQSLDPAVVAAVAFTLTVAIFAVPRASKTPPRKTPPSKTPPGGSHLRDVAALNLTTALTWITLLYALKFLEPAVVNAVSLAVGPAITVIAGPLLRRGSSVLTAEAGAAIAMLAVIAVLCWGSADGLTSIGHIGLGRGLTGFGLTFVSGLGSAGTFIYTQRLREGGGRPTAGP